MPSRILSVLAFLTGASNGQAIARTNGDVDESHALARFLLAFSPQSAANPYSARHSLGRIAMTGTNDRRNSVKRDHAALPARRSKFDRRQALLGATAFLSLPGVASAGDFGGGGALNANVPSSAQTSQISMTNLRYKELGACPDTFIKPVKAGPWDCIEISATATNVGRMKKPKAANVFGTMFDAEGFSPLAVSLDPTQKFGIQVLDGPFPQEKPQEVKFLLAVQSRAKRPFTFAGWKADYMSAGSASLAKPLSQCEQDSTLCSDDDEVP